MATALAPPTSRYEQAEIVNVIRQTVAKGATDAQLRMFLEVCRSTGLDPFLKEIYFVAEKSIIMASRDGYLRVANEHPQFDGMETRVERDEKNVPIKATCSVWRKDRSHAITCEAYYSEYRKSGPVWSQYPSAMISKVAEVLALKRSFAINGVVTEEEMGTERPSNVAPIRKQPQPAAAIVEHIPEEHEEAEVTYEEVEMDPEEKSQLERELAASIEMVERRKAMLEAYSTMKGRYRAINALKTYYAILGIHGQQEADGFASTVEGHQDAVACFADLRADVKAREVRGR
jgi:phage recombination protein Bet